MLHAAIRGLNSLADLDILQNFYEKYFGTTIENRNQTLLDVLRLEEEILRQKITWKEKYESVISGWITPKLDKGKLKIYKNTQEQQNILNQHTQLLETYQIIKTDNSNNGSSYDTKIIENSSSSENVIEKSTVVVPEEANKIVNDNEQKKPDAAAEITTEEKNPPALDTDDSTISTMATPKDETNDQQDANEKNENNPENS